MNAKGLPSETLQVILSSQILYKHRQLKKQFYIYTMVFSCLSKNLSENQCTLLLEHVLIKKNTTIRQNIHVISLISVVIRRESKLQINDNCKVLLIDSCHGDIHFSRCTFLKSLTIKNYKFTYHKDIYKNLLSLHLEGLNINTTIRLEKNLRIVKLVNLTTGWFKSVEINSNYASIYVRNFNGSLNIPSLLIHSSKIFTRKTTAIAHEVMPGVFGRTMFLDDVYLLKDYEIPNDVESVTLRNFKTNGKAGLKMNKMCKYLKLNVYKGCIDMSEMRNIKNVAFISCLPAFNDNIWEFSDRCKCPVDTTRIEKKNIPNDIENLILERVNVPVDHLLVVNESCRNVAIIFSEGDFDLSKIKELKGLKLIVRGKCFINIRFPDLSNVTTLEVSLDENEEYFNFLLSACINVRKLILYNTVCELHDWIENESMIIYEEGMAPWGLNELKPMIGPEGRVYRCRSIDTLSKDLYVYLEFISDYTRRIVMEDLSITAFSIDNDSLKQLKQFIALKKLCIVAQIIPADLFDNLPFSLRDFSLTLILCHKITDINISTMDDVYVKEKNTKNIKLVNLRLHALFIVNMDRFTSFPVEVEVLEIVPLVKISDALMQVREKMKVRRLIIMQMDFRTRETFRYDYAVEEYFDRLLNVLLQYIDFASIKEIKILDRDAEKSVDPRDYNTDG
ncbi:putative LRR containing protein [Trachipleistophora hominis]|uniref:Putative LRR containing protein n=1 Tax=Trachipleistophora hominis TaxID=72359 RepID=L7JSV0_TRAHO|nr:putative LRR containing protein [Trachipleistophora hominis]